MLRKLIQNITGAMDNDYIFVGLILIAMYAAYQI